MNKKILFGGMLFAVLVTVGLAQLPQSATASSSPSFSQVTIANPSTSILVFQNGATGAVRQAFIKWNTRAGTPEFYLGNDPNVSGGALLQLLDGSGNVIWTSDGNRNTMFGGQTNAGYRLDVQTAGATGTARFYNQAASGVTYVEERAGSGQSTNPLHKWLANDGTTVLAQVFADGTIGTSTKTPASAGDAGTPGQWAWDGSYIYVCTGPNAWKRAAIASW